MPACLREGTSAWLGWRELALTVCREYRSSRLALRKILRTARRRGFSAPGGSSLRFRHKKWCASWLPWHGPQSAGGVRFASGSSPARSFFTATLMTISACRARSIESLALPTCDAKSCKSSSPVVPSAAARARACATLADLNAAFVCGFSNAFPFLGMLMQREDERGDARGEAF